MLRSTIEKILPQLDGIADHLRIHRSDRNAFFWTGGVHPGDVLVDIGEIHVGSQHRLRFSVGGVLLQAWNVRWPPDGDVRYYPLGENEVAELQRVNNP